MFTMEPLLQTYPAEFNYDTLIPGVRYYVGAEGDQILTPAKILAGDEWFIHNQLGALLVDGTRGATHTKLLALIVHTMCDHREGESNAQCTPALAITKM